MEPAYEQHAEHLRLYENAMAKSDYLAAIDRLSDAIDSCPYPTYRDDLARRLRDVRAMIPANRLQKLLLHIGTPIAQRRWEKRERAA